MKKIWLPIPMGNFPKIPKITLRTACEHFKKQLEQKVTVYVLLPAHGTKLHVVQTLVCNQFGDSGEAKSQLKYIFFIKNMKNPDFGPLQMLFSVCINNSDTKH